MRVITAILQLVISVGDNLFSFLHAAVTIKVSSWHNEVTQPVGAEVDYHLGCLYDFVEPPQNS